MTLEIGAVAEAVEVTATAVQLESQTTSLGKVMQTKQIAELPVLGRSVMQLLSAIPGVQPPGGQTVSGSGETYEVKMAGGMQTQNGVLNGWRREPRAHLYGIVLYAADRIGIRISRRHRNISGRVRARGRRRCKHRHQIREQTSSMGSSTSSCVTTISMPIAGRTTEREFKRNLFQRNEYGAAFGGPIKRDRTFFFLNYEAQRQGTPIDFVSTVPTADSAREISRGHWTALACP